MDAIWAHIIRFSSGSIFPHVSSKLFIICHLFRISAFPAQTHTHHLSSFEVCRIFHRWICLIMIYEWGSVQPSQHVIDSAYYISGTSRTERRERDEQKTISLFSSIRIKPSKCNNILCTWIRILFPILINLRNTRVHLLFTPLILLTSYFSLFFCISSCHENAFAFDVSFVIHACKRIGRWKGGIPLDLLCGRKRVKNVAHSLHSMEENGEKSVYGRKAMFS